MLSFQCMNRHFTAIKSCNKLVGPICGHTRLTLNHCLNKWKISLIGYRLKQINLF